MPQTGVKSSVESGIANGGFDFDEISLKRHDEKDPTDPVEHYHTKDVHEGETDGPGGNGVIVGAEKSRPVWGNSIEFLMSCISMSVGLGNIWRFPFTAYENGGGAFLIPYIIVLIIIGKPMYYLEMILGQFTSRSGVKIWSLNPLFKGVGIGQLLATICVITYYCSMIALSLHYMFASFSSDLPWNTCRPEWENCVDSKPMQSNITVTPGEGSSSSSEYYFLTTVLKETDDITHGIGTPDWKLSLWLLLAWAVVYLIIIRGVRSSGKAAYFLALFPYVVIITLLIQACTLDGAVDGILFFIKPQFSELLNPKVWYAATTQLFFSLSVGMGTIVMFSSYNRFDHNIYRDVLIVTSLDTFTSLLAGFTIFAILGNLAHNLGISDISKVVKSGTGLAFISYPDAISKIQFVPQLFSFLFFLMLFVLGIGSVVALVSAVVTILWDQFPKFKYWQMAIFVCVGGFLCGLIYITPGGQWMLNLVDHFGGTFLVFTLAIFELIGVLWIYGLDNFCDDVEFMLNRRPGAYWRICWVLVTPIFMLIIFIYSMVTYEQLLYGGRKYPEAAYAAGWTLLAIGVVLLPLWAAYIMEWKGSMWKNIKNAAKPKENWGPKSAALNNEWQKFKDDRRGARECARKITNHGKFRQFVAGVLGF